MLWNISFSKRSRSIRSVQSPAVPLSSDCSSAAGKQSETGMATAEFALVLPALVTVTALLVAAVGLAGMQVRACEAARVAARAASLSDSSPAAVTADTNAGSAISVSTNRDGEWIHTRASIRSAGILGARLTISCPAVGIQERVLE